MEEKKIRDYHEIIEDIKFLGEKGGFDGSFDDEAEGGLESLNTGIPEEVLLDLLNELISVLYYRCSTITEIYRILEEESLKSRIVMRSALGGITSMFINEKESEKLKAAKGLNAFLEALGKFAEGVDELSKEEKEDEIPEKIPENMLN